MACKHLPGETCHCNQYSPCLIGYQIESDSGSIQYQNGGANRQHLSLVDNGAGAKIAVTVEGSCGSHLATCPSGYITDHQAFSAPLSATVCQEHVLAYRPEPNQRMGLLSAIQNMLSENKKKGVPSTRYQVCLTQCMGKPQLPTTVWLSPPVSYLLGINPADSFIDVYPAVKIQSNLTLSGKYIKKSISDEARYQAYQYKERASQLDSLAVPSSEIEKGFSISGSLSIEEGRHETQYGVAYEHLDSNIPGKPSTRNLSVEFEGIKQQMNLVRAACNIAEQIQAGLYTNERGKGKEDIKVFSYELQPPTLMLEGEQRLEMTNHGLGVTGKVTLKLAPLIGMEMKLDMLMAAATYFKLGKQVSVMRQKAAELEKKVNEGGKGAYAGAEFDIMLSTTLGAQGSILYQGDAKPQYEFDATTTVPISGNLNVRGGANVWVMEGAFKLNSRIKAVGALTLTTKTQDANASSVELVFHHEGIWAEVMIDGSFKWDGDKSDSSNGKGGLGGVLSDESVQEKSTSEPVVKRWDWVEALTKEASPYRVTVID